MYPDGLCRAICKGLMRQIEADQQGQFLLANLRGTDREKKDIEQQLREEFKTVESTEDPRMEAAWDDVTGAELDPAQVKSARVDEIKYIRKMRLYTKVDKVECWNKTGKMPIKVRWIDINKGDVKDPNYRSRLVAKEINTYKRDDLFAATPPLEAMKMVMSIAATNNKGEIIMINDVSRAFFHARVKRDVYVELPDEDKMLGEEKKCAKLNFSLYGTRDAALNWHEEYSKQLMDNGFVQGAASPCIFYHPQRNIRTVVHGDDYISVGMEEDLLWLEMRMKTKYEIRTKLLGPQQHHSQEVKVLNRILTWGQNGISYEADPRHAEIMIKGVGVTGVHASEYTRNKYRRPHEGGQCR